jgi:hypothetical protein
VAKGVDTASSDMDVMIITDRPTYAGVLPTLEKASAGWGRAILSTLYVRNESAMRINTDNSFVKRVFAQLKIWIIGRESELSFG